MTERILVIKLGALGDFMLALGAMEAIRKHHRDAHITLLTTKPFHDLAKKSGYFNDIIVSSRPRFYELGDWFFLFRKLNEGGYSRVYDLQLNTRTGIYYRLFIKKPEWSGVIPGSSLFYPNAQWRDMHAFDRHREILKVAGIDVSLPDLSWMTSDASRFEVPSPYVLFVPGSAPTRPEKRWPAKRFGALALKLQREGCNVALIGTDQEGDLMEQICRLCPEAIDLSGRTTLFDIASLARRARAIIGNDTGPVHITALAGCPTVALFSAVISNPAHSAPVGKAVRTVLAEDMETLGVGPVQAALEEIAP